MRNGAELALNQVVSSHWVRTSSHFGALSELCSIIVLCMYDVA